MLTEHFRPPVALLDLSRRSSDEILLSNFLCAASLLRRYVHLGLTPPMATINKREQYVEYTEHCLKLAKLTPDPESRLILREMAAEWLRLAELTSTPNR
jgi:hypothetical protein